MNKDKDNVIRSKSTLKILTRSVLAAIIVILSTFALTACGTDDIDISGYEDQNITISGIVDNDIKLTIADLKSMDCITKKAESTSDKIGKVRATGPTLDTVMAQYGMSQSDLSSAHIIASDGYDIKLSDDFLENNREIILAYGIDGKPLDPEEEPIRLIIPGSDSAYWIRMVEKIECK